MHCQSCCCSLSVGLDFRAGLALPCRCAEPCHCYAARMLRGGASLVNYQPVFSVDGKLLLVCTGCTVSVYGVATSLLVSQLHGHTDKVTNITVVRYSGSAKSPLSHAWTSSLDGTVRLWDFGTGVSIKTVNVGHPVFSMVIPTVSAPSEKLKAAIAFLSVDYKKKSLEPKTVKWRGRILLHNLTNSTPIAGYLAKTAGTRFLEVSGSGGLVGMVDNNKIWVWRVPSRLFGNATAVAVTLFHHVRTLKVLAFDPTETVVAAGDETGRILLWQNIGEGTFAGDSELPKKGSKRKHEDGLSRRDGISKQDDAEALTTYHWHSHEVKFLTFSADGVYLISGGLEAVLVVWQIETGNKDFLPRLGGPLYFIANSPDPAEFAVSCADNSILFVNIGSRTVERSIQGIKPPRLIRKAGLTVEPTEGKMVLPTDNLSIQLYDVLHDRHVTEIQVYPRNYLPVPDKLKGPSAPMTMVTHVVFSSDGMVMVTVDSRLSEEGLGGSSHLKFWDREIGNLKYTENTVVHESSAEISAIAYHPSKHMAVSCTPCTAEFKVWVQDRKVGLQGDNYIFRWGCRSVGSYRRKPILCASFSHDGSILAVAAEELVTLWNPVTNGIVTVLTASPPKSISSLAFISKCQHLVTLSSGKKGQLVLWNLGSLSIHRVYNFTAEALAVDPTSPHFAVIISSPSSSGSSGVKGDSTCLIAVFNIDKACPIATWTIRNARGGSISFLPSNLPALEDDHKNGKLALGGKVLVLTETREFVVLDPHSSEDTEAEIVNTAELALQDHAPSAFVAMYGKQQPRSRRDALDVSRVKGDRPWGDLFNAPSHVLPPLSKLGLTFIDSMLDKLISE